MNPSTRFALRLDRVSSLLRSGSFEALNSVCKAESEKKTPMSWGSAMRR